MSLYLAFINCRRTFPATATTKKNNGFNTCHTMTGVRITWAEATGLVVPREPRNRHQRARHSRAFFSRGFVSKLGVDDTSCADENVIKSFISSSGDHNRRTTIPMMPMICGGREAMAVSVRLAGFAHSLPWNTQVESQQASK